MNSQRTLAVLCGLVLLSFAAVLQSEAGQNARATELAMAGPHNDAILLADGGGPMPNPVPLPWRTLTAAA